VTFNTLPEAFYDVLGEIPVHDSGLSLQTILGPGFRTWPVWTCDEVPAYVTEAMQAQKPFSWLLFPHCINQLGLPMPEQRVTFHAAKRVLGAESGEDSNGEEASDASNSDKGASGPRQHHRVAPPRMLTFLKLKSALRPCVDVREVLSLAAELLGHDPALVRDKVATHVPCPAVLRKSLIKLDMACMLWDRRCHRKGLKFVGCLLADASLQARHESSAHGCSALSSHSGFVPSSAGKWMFPPLSCER
jgi:hypothetical protein